MPLNVEELGIDRLSVGERLKLIELIWDSLPEQVDTADVSPWHLAELVIRRSDVEANPGVGKPWREVLERLGKQP